MPGVHYRQHTIHIAPGDRIVCVSDGIIEAQAGDEELWGEDRLESVMLDNPDAPAKQLAHIVLKSADEFAGHTEQFDDMTIIVLRIPSPKSSKLVQSTCSSQHGAGNLRA